MSRAALLSLCSIVLLAAPSIANVCVDCHQKISPNIVDDWNLSKHSEADIACDACHGDGHSSAATSTRSACRHSTPATNAIRTR